MELKAMKEMFLIQSTEIALIRLFTEWRITSTAVSYIFL